MEGLFINLNFRKVQWLLFGTYHQPSQKDSYYFNNLDKALDLYSHYDKKLSVGDFNAEVSDNFFSTIPYQHDLENLAKDKTCFKNANNPSVIDFFFTNNSLAFQNTTATFTALSDYQKLVLTVFFSLKTKQKNYFIKITKIQFFWLYNDLKTIFSTNTIGLCYQSDHNI